MSEALTIAGAVFQLTGLMLVFIELAAIRAHEFGTAAPRTRVASWEARRLP